MTGNPRIRTRSTALGRLQIGEFSTLVGLIKRAQMVTGHLFTISGVVCGFRPAGAGRMWATGARHADRGRRRHLAAPAGGLACHVRAPGALLDPHPETLRGLWRQRLRWATGAVQVFLGCLPLLLRWRSRGHVGDGGGVPGERRLGVRGGHADRSLDRRATAGSTLPVSVSGLVPREWGLTLGAVFFLQVAVGMALDRRYEPGVERYLPSVIGYPFAFWILTALTVVVGLPGARPGARPAGVWVSPDRGFRSDPDGPRPDHRGARRRSSFLRWRDRCLTFLLSSAWSRPVDALAWLVVSPAGSDGAPLWDVFLRDLGNACAGRAF